MWMIYKVKQRCGERVHPETVMVDGGLVGGELFVVFNIRKVRALRKGPQSRWRERNECGGWTSDLLTLASVSLFLYLRHISHFLVN